MHNIYDYMQQTKDERQSHLDLSLPCEERGTSSGECRGLLAVALETTIPRGRGIHCCHACHNGACSNWKHLYWGTAQENVEDAVEANVRHIAIPTIRTGDRNNHFGQLAWRSVTSKREEWSWANDIYEDYEKNCWGFNTRGRGAIFMMSRYGLSQQPAKSMLKRFREGWIPREDSLWLEDFELKNFGI